MNIPTADNQQFSEKTLKGFLLKNVDKNSQNPQIQLINEFLLGRVEAFWNDVVVPLQKMKRFDGNKIQWYFEIYKEGLEAHNVKKHPFMFIGWNGGPETVSNIVQFLKSKTLLEYIDLGPSYLSRCFSLISQWYREEVLSFRLQHIYNSPSPHEWILTAEREERGLMCEKNETIPQLVEVLNNIGLLMARKV